MNKEGNELGLEKYDVPSYGKTEPTMYELKHCYVRTFEYRNLSVDIFMDDYGQCYYFYLLGEHYNCGTYEMFPEDIIKYEIDKRLDTVRFLGNIDKKYWGAEIKYDNIEHTSRSLYYRGTKLKTLPKYLNTTQAIEYGIGIIEALLKKKKMGE